MSEDLSSEESGESGQDAGLVPPSPLDVVRAVFKEIEFDWDESDGALMTRVALKHQDVGVFCTADGSDFFQLVVTLSVRATPEFLPAVGEFLHRLNAGARRKVWEIDCDTGQIRLALHADLVTGALDAVYFRSMLHYLVSTADAVFPFLTGLLAGRMQASFAADQAEAALIAEFQGDSDDGPGDDPEP